MREPHHHRTFAHSRRDAIHRAGAQVSRSEHARHTGFEKQRLALLLPDARVPFGRHQVAAREHKTLGVAQHFGREPVAPRARADEDKERVGFLRAR